MKPPCRYCEERKVGCHIDCERYKSFLVENEKAKKERVKAKQERDLLFRANKQRR